jgi:hypothetical protein
VEMRIVLICITTVFESASKESSEYHSGSSAAKMDIFFTGQIHQDVGNQMYHTFEQGSSKGGRLRKSSVSRIRIVMLLYSMDGWMISFTLTPRYTSDMQATTTISILVALITVIMTFLTGELYASPRGLWSTFVLGSIRAGPLAGGYKTFDPEMDNDRIPCECLIEIPKMPGVLKVESSTVLRSLLQSGGCGSCISGWHQLV